jgi:hypothetical protein
MPNQLFYPKSTTICRISGDSDTLYLPSPRNLIIPGAKAGGATAGAVIECDFLVRKGMVKEGDVMYNNKIGDPQRGQMAFIVDTDYSANTVTITSNIGVVATTPFRIYKHAPDPCIIMTPGIINKSDILSLEDASGNPFAFVSGHAAALGGLNPLPVQVTRLLKTGSSLNEPGFDYIICMHN